MVRRLKWYVDLYLRLHEFNIFFKGVLAGDVEGMGEWGAALSLKLSLRQRRILTLMVVIIAIIRITIIITISMRVAWSVDAVLVSSHALRTKCA